MCSVHRFRLVPKQIRAKLQLEQGERVVAAAPEPDGGYVVASTLALYLPPGDSAVTDATAAGTAHEGGYERLPWERVDRAEWDREAEVLQVTPTVPFGEPVTYRVVRLTEASERLLTTIRERVTASIVVDRQVPLRGDLGVRVVGRRRLAGEAPMTWALVFDVGLDPNDAGVYDAAQAALAEVQTEVEP